jgi:hypothetical protein
MEVSDSLCTASFIIESSIEEVWEEELEDTPGEEDSAPAIPVFDTHIAEVQRAASLVYWISGFIISLQAHYYIPDAGIDKLFLFLYVLLILK